MTSNALRVATAGAARRIRATATCTRWRRRANEQLGLLDEAANHWAAILAADPDHSYANRRLAAVLERAGDAAGAIDCLRRVVEATRGQDRQTRSPASASRCPRTGSTTRRSALLTRRREEQARRRRRAGRPGERPARRRSHRGRDHGLLRGRCASTRIRLRPTAASASPIRGSSAGTRRPRPSG